MNTDVIPVAYRRFAYVAYALGSVVVAYLMTKRVIGADEAALWAGIGTALGLTAAAYTGSTAPSEADPVAGESREVEPTVVEDEVGRPVEVLDPPEPTTHP